MQHFTLEFVSNRDLYQSYMPFMKKGGLFIRITDVTTIDTIELGADVRLDVILPNAIDSSKIIGKVSWITPVGVQSGTPAGIGVNFIEDPDNVRDEIDKAIGRLLNSSEPTLTM